MFISPWCTQIVLERVQSVCRAGGEPVCVGAKETTVRLQWAKLQALIGWSMKGFSLKPVELLPFLVVLETCGAKQTWTQWLKTRRTHTHTQSPWWLQTLYIISTNNWGQTIHFLPLTCRACGLFAFNIIHVPFSKWNILETWSVIAGKLSVSLEN